MLDAKSTVLCFYQRPMEFVYIDISITHYRDSKMVGDIVQKQHDISLCSSSVLLFVAPCIPDTGVIEPVAVFDFDGSVCVYICMLSVGQSRWCTYCHFVWV